MLGAGNELLESPAYQCGAIHTQKSGTREIGGMDFPAAVE
jgi:hypothetical protein